MYPGSFIWSRISDEWLVSRDASRWLGVSALIILLVTIAIFADLPSQTGSVAPNLVWGIAGTFGAISVFFVWGAMWRYWMRDEPSLRANRRAWGVLLTVGVWYGAILYYLFVYLPATNRIRS